MGGSMAGENGIEKQPAPIPTPDGLMPRESNCSPRQIQNYLNRVSDSERCLACSFIPATYNPSL